MVCRVEVHTVGWERAAWVYGEDAHLSHNGSVKVTVGGSWRPLRTTADRLSSRKPYREC